MYIDEYFLHFFIIYTSLNFVVQYAFLHTLFQVQFYNFLYVFDGWIRYR